MAVLPSHAGESPLVAEPLYQRNAVANLDARILEILEATDTPGIIGTIVYGNEVVWTGTLGLADIDSGQTVTPDSLFRVGSISKSIVSLAILRLVERGEVSLDDVVSELVPQSGIENAWELTDPVRLVHTLEHTAGFDDIHFRDFAFNDGSVTTQQGIDFNSSSRVVRWRPGTRMAYSNMGPAIAARALENVTGIAFEDFARREIFIPLGMNSTSFFFDERIASSYRPNGDRFPYMNIPVRSSGAMNTSTADMAQLLKMFIGRGQFNDTVVVTPESLQRMESPMTTIAAGQGIQVGYGLGNYSTVANGFVFYGHDGGIDGFLSRYAYLPEEGRGYFFSINQPNGAAFRQIDSLLREVISSGLTPPDKVATVDLTQDQLDGFTGVYEVDAPRQQLLAGAQKLIPTTIRSENGTLILKPWLGQATHLLAVNDTLFRREGDPVATFAFVSSPDDELLLQTGMSSLQQISPLRAYSRLAAATYAGLVLIFCLLCSVIWLLSMLVRHRNFDLLRVRVVPAAATLLFAGYGLVLMAMTASPAIGQRTFLTGSYWLVSWLLPVAALASAAVVASTWSRRQQAGYGVWHLSLHTTIALSIVVAFLFSFGFVGLRTWAY